MITTTSYVYTQQFWCMLTWLVACPDSSIRLITVSTNLAFWLANFPSIAMISDRIPLAWLHFCFGTHNFRKSCSWPHCWIRSDSSPTRMTVSCVHHVWWWGSHCLLLSLIHSSSVGQVQPWPTLATGDAPNMLCCSMVMLLSQRFSYISIIHKRCTVHWPRWILDQYLHVNAKICIKACIANYNSSERRNATAHADGFCVIICMHDRLYILHMHTMIAYTFTGAGAGATWVVHVLAIPWPLARVWVALRWRSSLLVALHVSFRLEKRHWAIFLQ